MYIRLFVKHKTYLLTKNGFIKNRYFYEAIVVLVAGGHLSYRFSYPYQSLQIFPSPS